LLVNGFKEMKYPEYIVKLLANRPKMGIRKAYDKDGVLKDGCCYILIWEIQHGGFKQHVPKVIP
jgi:hypothetical protein